MIPIDDYILMLSTFSNLFIAVDFLFSVSSESSHLWFKIKEMEFPSTWIYNAFPNMMIPCLFVGFLLLLELLSCLRQMEMNLSLLQWLQEMAH